MLRKRIWISEEIFWIRGRKTCKFPKKEQNRKMIIAISFIQIHFSPRKSPRNSRPLRQNTRHPKRCLVSIKLYQVNFIRFLMPSSSLSNFRNFKPLLLARGKLSEESGKFREISSVRDPTCQKIERKILINFQTTVTY